MKHKLNKMILFNFSAMLSKQNDIVNLENAQTQVNEITSSVNDLFLSVKDLRLSANILHSLLTLNMFCKRFTLSVDV